MSGSHGDLFDEIGRLVLAAHGGQAVDLAAKSKELTLRYGKLGVSPEIIAKIISRSVGAISFSAARISLGETGAVGENGANRHGANGDHRDQSEGSEGEDSSELPALPKSLFPSGVRLAVLS
jgi:hypothetical protein